MFRSVVDYSIQGSEVFSSAFSHGTGTNSTSEIDFLKSTRSAMDTTHEPPFEHPLVPNSTSQLLKAVQKGDQFSTAESAVSAEDWEAFVTYIIPYVTFYTLKYVLMPLILLACVCKLWEIYCFNLRDKSCPLPLPDGKMGIPIFGEMFHFLFLGVSFQRARRKEYGIIYRTHLFGRPTIRVSGEKYIKKLLLGEGQTVETKWPYTTRVILGTDGIVNGSKETHTTIKKLALRALSPRFMETYAPSVQRSIKKHIADWNRKGEIFILEECKQLIARTMMTVLLGIEEDDPDLQKYISSADDIINSILCIPLDVPYSVWRRGKRAREFIFEQMKMRLKAKMECSDEELFGYPDARSCYPEKSADEIAASTGGRDSVLVNIIKLARIEGDKSIKLKNLQNLALEIIFAGTQSLQSSSSLLILHLSQNPQVLARLKEEIKENGLWDVPLEEIPHRKINGLSYASSVVNECLRVTPPIPGAIRVAKKTFELNGFQVPKGWQVMFSIRETHEIASGQEKPLQAVHLPYDPTYFSCGKCKNSENLNLADRRTTEVEQKSHTCHNKNGPFSFIPFGKGTRMCAGVNYALFVLRVLAIEIARSSIFEATTPITLKLIPMTKPASVVKVSFSSSRTDDKEDTSATIR